MTIYELCLSHSRADRELRTKISDILEPQQLTMMQWLLLGSISGAKHGLSMGDIASVLGITLPQVTALLSNLVQRKIVRLKTQSRDRRSRHAVLTAKGDTLLAEVNEKLENSAELLFPNGTREVYAELLLKLSPATQEQSLVNEEETQ